MSVYAIGPYCYSDELYHHGVKGQKWGERNYQYEDGSLTPAGRDRYGYGEKRTLGQKIVGHLENRGRKLDAKSGGHGYRKAVLGHLGRQTLNIAAGTSVNLLTKGEYTKQVNIGAGVIGSISRIMMARDLASVYTSRRMS